VVGGTNGVYAFNYKGVLIYGWPAYLDKRYWYLRGDVRFAPAIGSDFQGQPLTVFSTMSGEHETYKMAHIIRADRTSGTVVYVYGPDSALDSITHLRSSLIDTLLLLNDSLAPPLVMWGGFVDAVTSKAVRPEFGLCLNNVGAVRESYWPFSVGAPLATAPILTDMDDNDSIDMIAIGMNGLVYRWQAGPDVLGKTLFWPQTGYNNSRIFAYLGIAPTITAQEADPITFFSYPNPTQGSSVAVFRYKFSAPATNVRLDIFTYTGFCVYSNNALSGSFPDYTEQEISLARIGPGVYRCRLQATISGSRRTKFWKMAVVK
jgi:hypothetical protein